MAKPKTNSMVAVLVLVLFLALIAGALGYVYLQNRQNPPRFVAERQGIGNTLYDRIMQFDAFENYPRTPEEVIDLFMDTVNMLHGDIILDETLYDEIISQQRILYGTDILMMNNHEEQREALLSNLEVLRESGARSIVLKQKPAVYERDVLDECSIRVVHTLSVIGDVEIEYILRRNNADQWKIIGVIEQ